MWLFYFQIDVVSLYLLFLVETITSGLEIISSLDEVIITILNNTINILTFSPNYPFAYSIVIDSLKFRNLFDEDAPFLFNAQ